MAYGPEAKRRDRARPRRSTPAGASSTAPARRRAPRPSARCRRARRIGTAAGPAVGAWLACVSCNGVLGGVGAHLRGGGKAVLAHATGRKSHRETVQSLAGAHTRDVKTSTTAPQATQPLWAVPHRIHRPRRDSGRNRDRRDRRGRIRPVGRPVGAEPRLAQAELAGASSRGVRRQRHATRLHPVRRAALADHHRTDTAPSARRDRRDRGSALLPEQRRRPDRHLSLGGQGRPARPSAAGRLHDHDAADAQPISGQRHAHLQAEDRRGEARDRIQQTPQQAFDPDRLPQQRRLRHGRRADRARSAGRLEDLLRQEPPTSWTCNRRRCSRACHKRPRNTTRSCTRRLHASGATRYWPRWPNCTTSPATQAATAEARPARK